MDVNELRERAAEHRRRAEQSKDHAVKDSHHLLAELYEEEADELERRKE